jgi:GT2 family glycosyltransferase
VPREPKISITIATWRRRDLLKTVIDAAERQTMPREDYEIIVCDSGSGDGTAELMADLMGRYSNLRYIDLDVNTLAAKRNTGVHAARAEIVVFLDDDAVPSPGFVEGHWGAHVGKNNQVICGGVRFPQTWIARSNYFRFRDSRHLGPMRPEVDTNDIPYHMIVVMNLSFRKEEILNRAGLVSEEFQRYGGEDYEFGYRVARSGLKIRFAPEALAEHHESGGSIRQYVKKLYITSRDSLPVLYRLAPDARETALSRWLEPDGPANSLAAKFARKLLRAALNHRCVEAVERILERTDHWRACYSPALFRYVFAGAMLQGIRDRAGIPGQPASQGWFD